MLLAGIGFYFLLISVAADQIGVRYLLPIFPLLFVWTSRFVPSFASVRGGYLVIVLLLAWQAGSALRVFPNHIAYFNEIAGGPQAGPLLLDDSNVDWGQGIKQAAEYVRTRNLTNVYMTRSRPLITRSTTGCRRISRRKTRFSGSWRISRALERTLSVRITWRE